MSCTTTEVARQPASDTLRNPPFTQMSLGAYFPVGVTSGRWSCPHVLEEKSYNVYIQSYDLNNQGCPKFRDKCRDPKCSLESDRTGIYAKTVSSKSYDVVDQNDKVLAHYELRNDQGLIRGATLECDDGLTGTFKASPFIDGNSSIWFSLYSGEVTHPKFTPSKFWGTLTFSPYGQYFVLRIRSIERDPMRFEPGSSKVNGYGINGIYDFRYNGNKGEWDSYRGQGQGASANGQCRLKIQRLEKVVESGGPDCGQKQYKIADRVADCARFPGSSHTTHVGVRWDLVARKTDADGRVAKVWRDTKSMLIWSDVILRSESRVFESAVELNLPKNSSISKHCPKYHVPVEQAEYSALSANCDVAKETKCGSEAGIAAAAGIQEVQFGLPSAQEVALSYDNGMLEILPNLEQPFWTLSLWPDLTKNLSGDEWPLVFNANAIPVHYLLHSNPERLYIEPFEKRPVADVRCVGSERGKTWRDRTAIAWDKLEYLGDEPLPARLKKEEERIKKLRLAPECEAMQLQLGEYAVRTLDYYNQSRSRAFQGNPTPTTSPTRAVREMIDESRGKYGSSRLSEECQKPRELSKLLSEMQEYLKAIQMYDQ